MKNKIRKQFIAGVMVLSFAFMGVSPLAYAQDAEPVIRTVQTIKSLDLSSDGQIQNGDSIVNLSLRDADVMQVLRMFADQAGMNIIFAQDISGKVTMDLVNITLQKALGLVTTTSKLRYGIQGNTMIVTSADDEDIDMAAGSKDIIIVPVKYVSAASIAEFLNKSIFTKTSVSPGVSSKPVVTTNPANNELIIMGTRDDAIMAQKIIDQFDKKPPITNYKVNHVTPAEMAGLICSTLIPSFMSNGEGATGGAAGVPTGFASDSFSSSGGAEGLAIGGGKLLCSVDQKADTDDMSSLPFKNMTVSYFPTNGIIQIIGGSQTQLDMIKDYIAANDIKAPQAYIEFQLISINEEGQKSLNNTWELRSKWLTINSEEGKTSVSKSYPIFLAGHGYSEGGEEGPQQWSGSTQLMWTINYLIANTKARKLANPRVLVTNGQPAVIDLTTDYVAKTTSQYLDSTGGGASAQVQKDYDIQSDLGIKITATPFISPDGYVTLDLSPEYSEIADQRFDAKGDIAVTLLSRKNLDLKGIRIKDGETLILGGLIREYESSSVTKIPILGDLPFIGMIFRSTGKNKIKEELVIMITPQIVVDTEDASEITDLDL